MLRFVRKMKWSARQLLPLTYRTKYRTEDGRQQFCVWRMWFGRVFSIDTVEIG